MNAGKKGVCRVDQYLRGLAAGLLTAPDMDAGREGVCGVCHDPLEDAVQAACGHAFCRVCITEFLETATGHAGCPDCSKPLTLDLSSSAVVSLIQSAMLRCSCICMTCKSVCRLDSRRVWGVFPLCFRAPACHKHA